MNPDIGRPWAAGVAYTIVVFAVSWQASTWCIRRFRVPRDPVSRAGMGAVAFAALMALELGVAVLAFGETLPDYLAKFATAPGLVGLSVQGGFAMIPWLQCRLRTGTRLR